jgi:hypothetical protein
VNRLVINLSARDRNMTYQKSYAKAQADLKALVAGMDADLTGRAA